MAEEDRKLKQKQAEEMLRRRMAEEDRKLKQKQAEEMLRQRMAEEDRKLKQTQAEEMLRQRMAEEDRKLKQKQAEEMLRRRMEDEKKLKEAATARLSSSTTSPATFSESPSEASKRKTLGVWIENATNYILRINLEGFRKDDMTVQMDDADNKISVLAQGPMDGGPRFFKEYPLPSKAILNDIHANFEAGVLAVTAPKRPAAPTQTTIEEETRKAAKAKKHGESTHDPFDSDEEGKWIENATNYVLRIKLQGISKEDVRVQGNIKGGITVRGHFPDGGPCLFNESFLLPSTASLACMSASFGANILTVTVPKRTLPTLSPTAVEIRRPMAKPQTKGLPVDCTKQLPSKDDAE
ncbi:hypothetical protein BRADI_3g14550v3 [Brachypodium distachyon]|uniref:SHSP domain-containing protein n=1 Tax=Brachypodium distachyon TaxID=15368 RepID=A0A2K2CX47_BRADI|nr:hypothetical protein BRADI_3g14550v3 [Brachypodium distachyon]